MATKSTNGTLWTLVFIAIVVIVFWKVIWPKIKNAGNSGSSGNGAAANAGGDPYASDNGWNPWQSGQNGGGSGSGLNLGGGGSFGGGSSGGGGSPGSQTGGPSGAGYANPYSDGTGNNADFFNSLLEGLYTDSQGNVLVQGSESNPEFGGDSLFTFSDNNSNVNPLTDGSGGYIPYAGPDQDTTSLLNSFTNWFSGYQGAPVGSSPDGSIVSPSQASTASNDMDSNPGLTLPGGTSNLDGNEGGDNGAPVGYGGGDSFDPNSGSTGDTGDFPSNSFGNYGDQSNYFGGDYDGTNNDDGGDDD